MIWNIRIYFLRIVFLLLVSLITLRAGIITLVFNLTYMIEWNLLRFYTCRVEFTIIFDWISILFLRFVTLISAIVLFYRGSYIARDKNINRFIFLVLAFVFSIGAMISRPNIIRILLGWDGLGLVSYALVIYYQNEKSSNAGILTVLSNRVGDVAILLRIALIFSSGRWNFTLLISEIRDDHIILKILVMLAAITKRAQIPFSAWLPAAIAAPTPVSALVHSSTLVTAGVYLLIRFRGFLSDSKIQPFLLIISSITIFIAGLGANFEYDLKKIIALSTLRQLGVIIRILALGFPILAFFHLLAHALFKALLFICAGVIIHNVKNYQDVRLIGGLANFIPLTVICINLANLSLCGTPFLAGFYSKDLILEVAFIRNINTIAFLLYVFATGLTVCYTFRLIFIRLRGVFNLRTLYQINDESKIITTPIIVLGLGAIAGGSILSWIILPDPYIICITFFFKIIVLIVRALGALVGYILNIIKVNYKLKALDLYFRTVIAGSIWFIPFLSTFFRSVFKLKTAKILQDNIDKGWSEHLGGQGIYLSVIKTTSYIQIIQDSTIKLYLKRFFFWIILIFFLSIYSYNSIRIAHWSCENDFISVNIFRNKIFVFTMKM